MLITKLVPSADAALSFSREELAGYILEHLNVEAAGAIGDYGQNQRNYMNGIQDAYGDRHVTDRFASSWRWLIDQDYLAEDMRQSHPGWWRLTAKGRDVKRHDQITIPRVPREVNPGPAPDFMRLTSDRHLAKQMHVLWEEAVLCYRADAHLATVVMLGSLLEGALLGKASDNSAAANQAKDAPRDKNGRVRALEQWRLFDFINVASEYGWIHKTRGDFVDVLRDYRNLVHPLKAKDVGFRIDKGTVAICWQVVTEVLRDLGMKV